VILRNKGIEDGFLDPEEIIGVFNRVTGLSEPYPISNNNYYFSNLPLS